MKKFWLVCTMVIAAGISSCVDSDKDLYKEDPGKEANTSNYSTVQTTQVEINYSLSKSKVPFLIYDTNPLEPVKNENGEETGTYKLNESISALDGAWTNDEGVYTGEMQLPAYVSDVYIVSKAFYAKSVMPGKIINGTLKVLDTDENQSITRAYTSPVTYEAGRFEKLGWYTRLGTFNAKSGMINYAYTGNNPSLTLSNSEMKAFRQTIYSVLNTFGTCPKEYRKSDDLYIEKDNTAIVLTALGGWTCWNSSLGYYYYREGNVPKKLTDVKVYAVFPNTQTTWDNGSNYKSSPQGVKEGTAVQLKYFGDNNEKIEGEDFPAGYRIGFVLACNSWDYKFTGYGTHTQTNNYISSSTQGLSSKGANNIDVHTAMFIDNNKNIAIAFEDFKDDENFTDVIFALKANPEIKNVPPVDVDLNTTIEKTGIYAFEDQWPKAGDYDMNDVLVQYTYQKKFNIYNNILEESFMFKPIANNWQAVFNNGLAFAISNAGTNVVTEDSIRNNGNAEFTPTTFGHENNGNVIRLSEGVKGQTTTEYKVTAKYAKGTTKTKESTINTFIYRSSPNNNDLRGEIHCPMERPSSKADPSLFGTQDDRSKPDQGIYYVSDKNNIYPFAFYLSNATVTDIAPLVDSYNEGTPINELYPNFINWAKNGTNADWYKKK